MVTRFKSVTGTRVKFGNGTVRVRPHVLQSRPGVQLELSSCKPTAIGETPDPVSRQMSEKVVLEFTSIQSIDVVMEKLQHLRECLEDQESEK